MAGDAAGRRLFFALWPDAPAAAALYRVAAESREACGGRLMRPETLHLTLAYLGRVADRCLPSVLAAGAAAAGDAPTVNLSGPVAIALPSRRGRQLVLNDARFDARTALAQVPGGADDTDS